MIFRNYMPLILRENPAWVHLFNVVDSLVQLVVLDRLPTVSQQVKEMDRESILRRSADMGWTYSDNFTSDWATNPQAQAFVEKFTESWIPYCKSYSGTQSLQEFMSYLLGMEVRIYQLYSRASSAWDTDQTPKLYSDPNTLPVNYTTTQTAGTFEPYGDLLSKEELDTQYPGWQSVRESPTGWYPTNHYDIELNLNLLPASDVPTKGSEVIIANLFYELADITSVLRSIVYSIDWNETVSVWTGSIVDEDLL